MISEILIALDLGFMYGLVAMGVYLTFRVIDFPDLTCDGSFVIGACSCAMALKAGFDPFTAVAVGAFTGAVAGLTSGLLRAYLGIPDLLSGILVAFMLYSVNLRILGGSPNISLFQLGTLFQEGPQGGSQGWAIWVSSTILLGVFALTAWGLVSLLLKTCWGLNLRSLGQNQNLAKHMGLNINGLTILALSLSNGLIGLAGALFTQHQGFVDLAQGIGTVVIGLASVMIGEKLLPARLIPLRLRVPVYLLMCVVGSLVYRMMTGLALHGDFLGLQTQDFNLLTGLLVIGTMGGSHFWSLLRRRLCFK